MSIAELSLLVNDNFDKPLNKQIEDMVRLIPSDTQLFDKKSLSIAKMPVTSETQTQTATKTVVMNNDGIANIKADLTYSVYYFNFLRAKLVCEILKNGTSIGSYTYSDIEVRQTETRSVENAIELPNVQFTAGDVFTFKCTVTASSSYTSTSSYLYDLQLLFNFYALTTLAPRDLITLE